MTRRDWLIRMFGAAVAATLAPLVDLTDTTPAFWNQPPIKRLLPRCRITFKGGTVFTFDANIVSEQLFEDGSFRFTLRPAGPMEISYDPPPPFIEDQCSHYKEPEEIVEGPPVSSPPSMSYEWEFPKDGVPSEETSPMFSVESGSPIEVRPIKISEIDLPRMSVEAEEINGSYVIGLQKTSTFTLSGKWID